MVYGGVRRPENETYPMSPGVFHENAPPPNPKEGGRRGVGGKRGAGTLEVCSGGRGEANARVHIARYSRKPRMGMGVAVPS